jgi:hypothetical protein
MDDKLINPERSKFLARRVFGLKVRIPLLCASTIICARSIVIAKSMYFLDWRVHVAYMNGMIRIFVFWTGNSRNGWYVGMLNWLAYVTAPAALSLSLFSDDGMTVS